MWRGEGVQDGWGWDEENPEKVNTAQCTKVQTSKKEAGMRYIYTVRRANVSMGRPGCARVFVLKWNAKFFVIKVFFVTCPLLNHLSIRHHQLTASFPGRSLLIYSLILYTHPPYLTSVTGLYFHFCSSIILLLILLPLNYYFLIRRPSLFFLITSTTSIYL
jgi:hypothetical protein